MRATFLTYIIGQYETVKEIETKTPDCDYVLVTDNKDIKSDTWRVVYVDNPYPDDPFWICYQIRFNPFKYVDTDIVVRIDGSMIPTGDFTYVLDYFEQGGYDRMLTHHPTRENIYDEYAAWIQTRGYDQTQAEKVLGFINNYEGYDVRQVRGLFQMNIEIVRNNKINNLCNAMTLNLLEYLAADGKEVERVDQTVFTFIVQKYFNQMKILLQDQSIGLSGKYFKWCKHNSNEVMEDVVSQRCEPCLFNKPTTITYLGY